MPGGKTMTGMRRTSMLRWWETIPAWVQAIGVVGALAGGAAAVASSYSQIPVLARNQAKDEDRIVLNEHRLTVIEAHAEDWTERLDRIEQKIDGTWPTEQKHRARRRPVEP